MARALILAAGKATRLEGIRDRFAKANVPIGNTTPLRFMLKQLAAAGVTEAWINLHYLADQVRTEAQRWAPKNLHLHFLEEPQLLGTGGTLLEVSKRSGGVPDVVVNAKMFTDFDFATLLQNAAQPAGSLLVLHPPTSLADFGGLAFNAEQQITALQPRSALAPAAPAGAAVFTGIARPDSAWLPFLEQAAATCGGEPVCSIRHGLLPALAAGVSCAKALLHMGYWKEISTPERVAEIRAEMPDLLS
jgi:NDP-sugar pyrophosphorylase family protein